MTEPIQVILNSENPSYNKEKYQDYTGHQVSISIDDDLYSGFVSGLEEGDNISFADAHLLRTWSESTQNTLTISIHSKLMTRNTHLSTTKAKEQELLNLVKILHLWMM